MSLVNVVCYHVGVSAKGRSLVKRSPADCDLETSRMRRPWPALGCFAREKKCV